VIVGAALENCNPDDAAHQRLALFTSLRSRQSDLLKGLSLSDNQFRFAAAGSAASAP
jgi:hypothetical protein